MPLYLPAFSLILPSKSITLRYRRLCLLAVSKSLKSWLGVIFTAPVPNSMSTVESAIIGISLSIKGRMSVLPIRFLYLLSSEFTATAVSPSIVSGLVVATVIVFLPSFKGYLM